jgi:hydroxymethylpyrimidine pyrophosphatase-like HAD family hydrolase
MSETFPLPEEKIALLDIDGTILDETYKITTYDFSVAVERAKEAGWLLGLSSDTPLTVMREFRDEFSMDGPIIAERGAVLEIIGDTFYDEELSQSCVDARDEIIEHFSSSGFRVWLGDPVSLIRNGGKIGKSGDLAVMVNEHRRCSLGIFARYIDREGQLIVDNSLTEYVVEETRPLYPRINSIDEDVNHDHGLLIVADGSVDKRLGTSRLQRVQNLGTIAMVGNSLPDYLGTDMAVHYAVGNATSEFKEVADYVSESSFSLGVADILEGLATNTKQPNL